MTEQSHSQYLERTIVLNNEAIGKATGLLELMEANDQPIDPEAMLDTAASVAN